MIDPARVILDIPPVSLSVLIAKLKTALVTWLCTLINTHGLRVSKNKSTVRLIGEILMLNPLNKSLWSVQIVNL